MWVKGRASAERVALPRFAHRAVKHTSCGEAALHMRSTLHLRYPATSFARRAHGRAVSPLTAADANGVASLPSFANFILHPSSLILLMCRQAHFMRRSRASCAKYASFAVSRNFIHPQGAVPSVRRSTSCGGGSLNYSLLPTLYSLLTTHSLYRRKCWTELKLEWYIFPCVFLLRLLSLECAMTCLQSRKARENEKRVCVSEELLKTKI